MKKMNKRLLIYLVCTVFILLSGAYIYKNYFFVSVSPIAKKAQIPLITPVPTGSGKINDPATWSLYSFAHEFTIAYPPSWVVVPDKSGDEVNFQTAFFHQDNDFTIPYGDSTDVSYSVFGQTDLSDMSFHNGDKFSDDQTQETDIVSNVVHKQINGFPAIEFDYYPTDNTHFVKTRIAIQNGQKLYRFNATYAENAGKALFERMMQSIHFSS